MLLLNAKNKERMENRNRIIELLTAVRYTTNDIEKVADEICSLFNVVGQSEQLCDNPHCQDGTVEVIYGETLRCSKCEK